MGVVSVCCACVYVFVRVCGMGGDVPSYSTNVNAILPYRPLEGFSPKGPIGLHSSKTTHARVSLFSLLKCCWLLCTQSGTNDQVFRGYFSARPHSVSPLTWHLRLPQQNRLIYLYYGILDSQTTVEQFLLRICNNFSSPKAKI